MKIDELKPCVFPPTKVLLIGDIMLDRYLFGGVQRISPEAPVPVLKYKEQIGRPGGMANVALNLQVLGAEVFPIAITGKDEHGESLVKILLEEGFETEGILSTSTRCTTVKTRIMAGNQQLLRVDEEEETDISGELEERVWNTVLKRIETRKPDILIFQDYDKGLLTSGLIRRIIDKAKSKGIMTAVDPKRAHFFDYKGIDLFKPNLKEVSDALHRNCSADCEDLLEASGQLSERLGFGYCFITLSDKGIFATDGKEALLSPVVKPMEVVDVCGAGDAVLSVVSMGVFHGMPLEQVNYLANLAGGLVCGIAGVSPIPGLKWFKEL